MLQEAMCMLNKTFLFATVHVKLDVDALQLTKQYSEAPESIGVLQGCQMAWPSFDTHAFGGVVVHRHTSV
ncbi:hypothetical protein UY3_06908 [Chelonia mydas]|uniref:Uncharacterized protein n=1 Tax=Chelonia mydas TaxID=8469 RepID=M7C5Z2_CHEMY|nr:hypothetical protein UY3_06908 [Chelonia mydas]